jgi:hypothetical protein
MIILFIVSPILIAAIGLVLASQATGGRWPIHLVTVPAIILMGPLLVTLAFRNMPDDQINAGTGMIFLPFVLIVPATVLIYAAAAFAIWFRKQNSRVTHDEINV